jgi:DNA-directed RNA polymerase specialized sigma subunit
LLHENRNLILAVIRVQYMGQVEDADLEQEGWIGFWQAIKRYDPGRGARFSTFAWLVTRRGQPNMDSSTAGFESRKMAGV